MKKLSFSKKIAVWVGALLAGTVALAALALVASVWTDYQWYLSVGQQSVFWTTTLSQATVWLVFAAAGFAVLYASARAAWLVISTRPRYPRATAFACLLLAGALAWSMSCLLYTSPSPRD